MRKGKKEKCLRDEVETESEKKKESQGQTTDIGSEIRIEIKVEMGRKEKVESRQGRFRMNNNSGSKLFLMDSHSVPMELP